MGRWERETEIISEVIEVLSPITEEFSDIRYVHSETSLVCLFRSKENFQEIDNYLKEELMDTIQEEGSLVLEWMEIWKNIC